MHTKSIALLLALSGVYATPISKRDECSDKCYTDYNACRSAPITNRAQCAADFSDCLGYRPFDSDGSLVTPTACTRTATATATPTPAADPCVDKCNTAYNACRSAPNTNRAQCAADYSSCLGYLPFNSEGSLVTPTACAATATATATPTSVPDPCVQKCNVAYDACRSAPNADRPKCASDYSACLGYAPFNSEGLLVTPTACATNAAPTITQTIAPAPTTHQPAQSAGWTIKSLIRYCAADQSGCDYNFDISTNDGQANARCTVIRTGVVNAPTESWYGQPCTAGSPYQISWGYSTQFEVPFAVLTVVDTAKNAQAYFGVNNPTGQAVTPSNPYGSGNFGDIGPQPVFFN